MGSCTGLLPIATSLQQEDAGHLHAASMLTHQLSHPLIQTLAMSKDEIACELSCSGETMDVDIRSAWRRVYRAGVNTLWCASTAFARMPRFHLQGVESTNVALHLHPIRTLSGSTGQCRNYVSIFFHLCQLVTLLCSKQAACLQKCTSAMDDASISSIYKCDGVHAYFPMNGTKNTQGFRVWVSRRVKVPCFS